MNATASPHQGSPAPARTADGPVLLCFDGARDATQAILAAGALLAKPTAIVLSVWQPAASMTPLDPVGDLVGRLSGIYAELDEIGAQQAAELAESGARLARQAGFSAEALTACGKPWVEIIRVAEARGVAAIVLGAHGPGRPSPIVLGSVSTRVLHHTSRPVIIIPATDAAATAN